MPRTVEIDAGALAAIKGGNLLYSEGKVVAVVQDELGATHSYGAWRLPGALMP